MQSAVRNKLRKPEEKLRDCWDYFYGDHYAVNLFHEHVLLVSLFFRIKAPFLYQIHNEDCAVMSTLQGVADIYDDNKLYTIISSNLTGS